MAHIYLDSSALVKRYVLEQGSEWIRELSSPASGHTLYTVRISGAEIVAAFFQRARMGSLSLSDAQQAVVQFKPDFYSHIDLVEITRPVVDSAMWLAEVHQLRGYDAVQLAAALALQDVRGAFGLSPMRFVCADERLNSAAVAAGIEDIVNPNDH